MISNLLKRLQEGVRIVRSNTKLLFVVFLVFFFPFIFLYTITVFYDTAFVNIKATDQQSVETLHTILESALHTDSQSVETILLGLADAFPQNILDIKIVEERDNHLMVIAATSQTSVGVKETDAQFYRTALAKPGETYIFTVYEQAGRTSYAVRAVLTTSGQTLYISTRHFYGTSDARMVERQQQSFVAIFVIFAFLIVLSYWIAKQTDWKQKYDALTVTMKERDAFAHMMAHELRTPLTAIQGYTSFLVESKNLSGEEQRFATIIQSSTKRLVALVNDFLEVARIQSGQLKLEKKPIDIQPVIQGVVDTLLGMAHDKQLTITYAPLAVPISLFSDAKRLHQILQNIVSNAIKYTEKGGITITTEVTPGRVTIRVKDTGMGISAEDQDKLFVPFQRVGGVEKTTIVGTGLGMWITKQLTETLGGTITVESIKEVGTHVIISFKR